jgi:hypothetical protein
MFGGLRRENFELMRGMDLQGISISATGTSGGRFVMRWWAGAGYDGFGPFRLLASGVTNCGQVDNTD